MKKFAALLSVLLLSALLAAGCGGRASAPADPAGSRDADISAPQGQVVEIKEKLFVAQSNDIYYNRQSYLGKTIKYEGLFSSYTDSATGNTYHSVIRYGPGCCGNDANVGFEVIWDKAYPQQNDWVEVTGVLVEYDENGTKYLQLRLSAMEVLTTRGAEVVTQ